MEADWRIQPYRNMITPQIIQGRLQHILWPSLYYLKNFHLILSDYSYQDVAHLYKDHGHKRTQFKNTSFGIAFAFLFEMVAFTHRASLITAWLFLSRVGVDPLPQLVLRHHDAISYPQRGKAFAVN